MSANDAARPLSRRTMLTGSALAALAAPAIAGSNLDAELLALGREYDDASRAMRLHDPDHAALNDACRARLDAWHKQNPPPSAGSAEAVVSAYLARRRAMTDEVVAPPEGHPHSVAFDRRATAEDMIGRYQARTLAGLALQARVAAEGAFGIGEGWDTPLDLLDWTPLCARVLAENLCRLAGVALPGSEG